MATKKYSNEHVWIEPLDGNNAKVGITVHAQDALGDVVFVEFPAVGSTWARGAVCGVVESVKAAADLYIPVAGTVTTINPALQADPALANTAPLTEGWFFTMTVADMAELDALMDEAAYRAFAQ